MRSLLGCCVGLLLVLVVDQVEGGVAALELPDTSIVHLPVELLPSGVREGDRVEVRARRLPGAPGARRTHRVEGPGRGEHAGEVRQEVTREQEGKP